MLTTWIHMDTRQLGFNSLMNYQDRMPKKYDSIIYNLNILYNEKKARLDYFNKYREELATENIKYLSDKFQWTPSAIIDKNTEYIDYMLNDPDFKTRVLQFRLFGYFSQLIHGLEYRGLAIQAYYDIATVLGAPKAQDHFNVTIDKNHEILGKAIDSKGRITNTILIKNLLVRTGPNSRVPIHMAPNNKIVSENGIYYWSKVEEDSVSYYSNNGRGGLQFRLKKID